ncbi:MAG: site-specific DNA-methyltransferase [Kiritimatiellia bacterium]
MPSIHFKGKALVQHHHLTVPTHELLPVKAKGLSPRPSLHDNLVVHGDNLKALKSLLPYYHGKVKCVYIDPPYNTGNEGWVYNDNVNSPMINDWIGKVVDREDLTRHDKWLCMMLPRLRLLRDFLREDGVIFISIDDNEVHRLRALLDEVFGEENFVANILWQKVFSPKNTAKYFSEDHDHIIVYARNLEVWKPNLIKRSDEALSRYENPDNDPRGPWATSDMTARNFYSLGTYEVKSPAGKKHKPSMGTYWRFSEENFWQLEKEGRIWWGTNGENMPRMKRYLSEVKDGVVPQTMWFYEDVGHTQDAKRELLALFDFQKSEDVFVTIKPTALLRRILEIGSAPGDIVMDCFAGTGGLAHAVLQLNKDSNKPRQFVIMESEPYADTLTAERVRRVIKGVKTAKDEDLRKGYGGTFSYFEVGEAMRLQSLLKGGKMPTYEDLAAYVYFTATGEEFQPEAVNRKKNFIGVGKRYEAYLLYEPNPEKLRDLALTLDFARALPKPKKDRRILVFAPTKYLDAEHLDLYQIDFCQLPYEIYKAAGRTR